MKNKRKRLQIISQLLKSNVIGSQEELQNLLVAQNCIVTQATLSRDLKQMKVVKTPLSNGMYKYIVPAVNQHIESSVETNHFSSGAILSLNFSGNLAVIKTKPGYASAIAWGIDNEAKHEVLGTIAGDDTILLVPREGVSRETIIELLHITFNENQAN
jgi:transcriptional regulator of arginine metabolism